MEDFKRQHREDWIKKAIEAGFTKEQAEFLYENVRPSFANTVFPSIF